MSAATSIGATALRLPTLFNLLPSLKPRRASPDNASGSMVLALVPLVFATTSNGAAALRLPTLSSPLLLEDRHYVNI